MYLATVIDTYSRKLAGYALADHMRVSLVVDALAHAHGVRGSLDGAVFHSDHGSVYTSQAFRDHCTQSGGLHELAARDDGIEAYEVETGLTPGQWTRRGLAMLLGSV